MEAKLDNILEHMMQQDKAIGASLSDNKLGFCYGSELIFIFREFLQIFTDNNDENFSPRQSLFQLIRRDNFHHRSGIETASQ